MLSLRLGIGEIGDRSGNVIGEGEGEGCENVSALLSTGGATGGEDLRGGSDGNGSTSGTGAGAMVGDGAIWILGSGVGVSEGSG